MGRNLVTGNRYTIREKITAMKWCAKKVLVEKWSPQRACTNEVSEYLAQTVQPDVGVQEECDVNGQWATISACTDCRGTSPVHL